MSSPVPFFPRPLCSVLLAALAMACSARGATPEFHTVRSTDFGKVLTLERSDAPPLVTALQRARTDLTQYFGAAPSVFNAFADSQDPHLGGATFVAMDKGVQVKGLVNCTVGEKTTKLSVVYIRSDAPPGEWAHLNSEGSPSPSNGSKTLVADGPLRTYNFPDGTGSIGLAEGWTTNAQSETHTVVVQGPHDQMLAIGGMSSVLTPRSTLPRGPGGLVAPFGSAVEVLEALVPQWSQLSVRQGGPSRTIDHLTKLGDQKGASGQLTLVKYGVTETLPGGAPKHYLAQAWVGLTPTGNGAYMVLLTTVRAPDATFEKDKPVMFQMLHSLKENAAAVQRLSNQQLALQKQRFEAQQARMHAQQKANDAQHAQYWATQKANDENKKAAADRQLVKDRSNDNEDEYIRGIRTVEDTQTGIKTSVDLGNVDKIVDDLNEKDPGRYKQIPLRDETHPLNGQ